MGYGDMMGGAYLWAVLVPILVTAAVAGIVAVVVLSARARRTGPPPAVQPREEAREILRRRYAAGEIDEDEYLQRLSGLAQQ